MSVLNLNFKKIAANKDKLTELSNVVDNLHSKVSSKENVIDKINNKIEALEDEFKKLLGISENNVKKDIVSKEIKSLILSGEISNNISGLKYAMRNGCEPKLFTEVVQKLEKDKMIERFGEVNNQSSNIHRAKVYQIKMLNNGT